MVNKVLWERVVLGDVTLQIVHGDITQEETDAIDNAANSQLLHGGGVAGAIAEKGGGWIQAESHRLAPVAVGDAVVTGAGKLPAKVVIHAVGPRMGEGDEERKLAGAVRQALYLATDRHLLSLSMPAISSGIFGFPKDRCADILLQTTVDFLRSNEKTFLRTIRFCNFDKPTCSIFLERFRAAEASLPNSRRAQE